MTTPLRVLLVEDCEDDALLLLRELQRRGYEPTCERVDTPAAMTAALANRPWDIVIADYSLPDFSGPAALALLQASGLDLPFIIVSGTIGEEVAVAAMKAGAHDYIMKDSLARLAPAVERELRDAEVRRERWRAAEALQEEAQVSGALAQVGKTLISALDTPELLVRLCEVTAAVLQCDASHTLLWRMEEDVYVPIAGYGATADEQEAVRIVRIPRVLMSDLLGRLDREHVAEVKTVPSDVLSPSRQLELGQAVHLCMPLRRGKEIIGIQTAFRRGSLASFSAQQRRISQGIAHLASLVLEHARLVDELGRASRLKSDFLATMSHELRTPLNVIIGYNDLLIEGAFGAFSGEAVEPLYRVGKSARELLELITTTLDLSRLEAGRLPLEVREVGLADMLHELDAETRELQAKRQVRFQWNVGPGLPHLHTDPVKLKVVLKNLVANAAKFTEHGSVTVTASSQDGGVEIAVADTGIGIAPEAQKVIFEPFRQVDSSSTRRHGGVGLGLYIVHRLLEMLGGRVSVESQRGRGSTFRVWLPRNRPAGQRAAPISQPS